MTNFSFTSSAWKHNNARLTNQIFKLLPLYEEGGEWKKQQQTLLLELQGYNKVLEGSSDFMVLIAKIAALDYAENQFDFRKLIFEAITELKQIQI